MDEMIVKDAGEVISVDACDLRVGTRTWSFAIDHREAIEQHWRQARALKPAYFNGTILVLADHDIVGRTFRGELLKTDFKSVLYWRSLGFPETGVRDAFGSAVVHSGDGGVVLAQQAAEHLNAGLAYLPGGFIDDRDIGADGSVDIAASVVRELSEETGLAPPAVERIDGFLVTRVGPHLSIAVAYRSTRSRAALLSAVGAYIAKADECELSRCMIVDRDTDLSALPLARYAEVLLPVVLRSTDADQ